MDIQFIERMREGLSNKRQKLAAWLQTTPVAKKDKQSGSGGEEAVRRHLHVVESTIDESRSDGFGQCSVCQGEVEPELLEIDYTSRVCLEHFSDEERRQLENELELAQDVQKTLLPKHAPDIPSLEIAAFSRPAQIVGGDYFDFFEFSSGAYGIAIADVSGHGVSVSLHMASVQTLLRSLVLTNDSPAAVVRSIHRLYMHNIHFTTFVTLFLCAYDATQRLITYCNAGHNAPLLYRRQNPVIWLEPTGAAIGLIDGLQYTEETVAVQPGDIFLLYTDGVVEAMNSERELFGAERLARLIDDLKDAPATEIVREVRRALKAFTDDQPLDDDVTLVVCKVTE